MLQWTLLITIEFILWIVDSFIVSYNFILLAREANKKYKLEIPASYDASLSIFFLLNLVAYVMLIMRQFFFELWNLTAYSGISREISQLLTLISLVTIMIGIERNIIKKSKYIFSALMSTYIIIVSILMSFFNISILIFPFNIINLGLLLVLPLFYIYIAAKFPGNLRKNALVMLIGLILMFLGAISTYENMVEIVPYLLENFIFEASSRITSVSTLITGLLIITYGFEKFGTEK